MSLMNPFGKPVFVGIDIGCYTIKAAQVERVPTGWRVSKVCTALTPLDSVKEGVVVDPTVVGVAIRQMLREAGISANLAAVAVAGGSVVVRPVRMPKMTEATLRKSIKFEAGRYVPSSAEDSLIEFEIIGDTEDGQMDVLMAAAPREVVESRVKACEFAGLDVECVDIEPFCSFRSLIEADPSHEYLDQTIAMVDIGGATTNMSVVSNGVFAMARSLPQGGQTLTDALKSHFRLSDEDAESGKAQLDLVDLMDENAPRENPPLRVVQPHIDDVIREVRRSLNYFQAQGAEGNQQARHVDLVVLTGGGAKMPGIAEYFTHKLGMKAVVAGVYDNSRFISAEVGEQDHGYELSVVTGLAMRGVGKAA